ncbi:MAG: radical SAM protein [Patescibacteria group bacterium]
MKFKDKKGSLLCVAKLTLNCPGNCKCCANRQELFNDKSKGGRLMSLELFLKICRELRELGGGYISLSGGEPTLLPNIVEYIKIAKQNQLVVRINTNGWGITEEFLTKWLDEGLDQICLSIYGLSSEEVAIMRGNKEIQTRTMNALDILSRVRRKRPFLFIMQTIIMRTNYTIIPKLLKKAFESKCDFFWPSYLEDAFNLPELRLDESDVSDFKDNISPKIIQIIKNNVTDKKQYKELCGQVDKYFNNCTYLNGVYREGANLSCSLLGHFLLIYPNGLVAPCPGHEYFVSCKELLFEDKTLGDILLSDKFKDFYLHHNQYCFYCPRGLHVGLKLNPNEIHEHISASELRY